MIDFRMPSLGADMEAGTLTEWMIKPGDRVKRGDVVAVVETQKGAIEIEIFESGRIGQILVDVGSKVPVGTPLATVLTEGEIATAAPVAAGTAPVARVESLPPPKAPPAAEPSRSIPSSPAAPPPPVMPLGQGALRASPAARRLAQQRGLDLSTVAGSGPDGAIVLADVERQSQPAAPLHEPSAAPRKPTGLDFDAMRAAIAAAMSRSKREIPHYYLLHECCMAAAEAWLARINAERSPERRLLMAVLTTKALALAVRKYPAFNGFYRDGQFEPAPGVHVGVAIALRGGGLIAPAIHNTADLSLDELMERMRDLVQRARSGRIRGSEMSDPTITASSLGERGVETLYGVIYPPQVAIVGFGKMVLRPWVVDGAIGPRPIVNLTLAADHRASDGHAGGLFLAEIGRLLQEPEKL